MCVQKLLIEDKQKSLVTEAADLFYSKSNLYNVIIIGSK